MAQTTVNLGGVNQQAPVEVAHKQLEVEKLGVIVGFLVGLPMAIGPVGDFLQAHGASEVVAGFGMVLTVIVSTAAGLRLGAALAALIGTRK
jgi:hypothetical protein